MTKLTLLAAALLTTLSVSPVLAASHMEAPTGATCAELNAMDAAGASAYLQGYMAGKHDAMMSGGMAAEGMATEGMATEGMAADGTATEGTATEGMAAGDTAMAADHGAMDPQAMIDACKAAPDATLGDTMNSMAPAQ